MRTTIGNKIIIIILFITLIITYGCTNNQGNKYIGELIDGKRNGYGTMIYENGDIYSGNRYNDMRRGQGEMLYANGNRYEGSRMGTPQGTGSMYYSKYGCKYIGTRNEGYIAGEGLDNGVYICDNGLKFTYRELIDTLYDVMTGFEAAQLRFSLLTVKGADCKNSNFIKDLNRIKSESTKYKNGLHKCLYLLQDSSEILDYYSEISFFIEYMNYMELFINTTEKLLTMCETPTDNKFETTFKKNYAALDESASKFIKEAELIEEYGTIIGINFENFRNKILNSNF